MVVALLLSALPVSAQANQKAQAHVAKLESALIDGAVLVMQKSQPGVLGKHSRHLKSLTQDAVKLFGEAYDTGPLKHCTNATLRAEYFWRTMLDSMNPRDQKHANEMIGRSRDEYREVMVECKRAMTMR